jgi:predicted lipoprotein with Yx(FWY)xxD motif
MRIRFVILAAVLATGLAACGSGGGGSTDHKSAPAASGTTNVSVKVSRSSLGPILTDQSGRTLYAFANDKNGTSNCTANCIATWPALVSRGTATAGAGVDKALLGQVKRADGTVQTMYNKWPLYYYAGDMNPGDVDGEGVDGLWFVLGANGKLIKK